MKIMWNYSAPLPGLLLKSSAIANSESQKRELRLFFQTT